MNTWKVNQKKGNSAIYRHCIAACITVCKSDDSPMREHNYECSKRLNWNEGLQSANTCIATYPAICRSDNISQLWLLKRFIIIIEVRTLRSADTCIAAHPAICRVAGCHYTWEVNWSNTRGQRDMTIHGWSEVNWSKLNWECHGLQTPISQPTHPAICESSETSLYVPWWSELNWTGLNWTESAPICRHRYYGTPCNMQEQQGMSICGKWMEAIHESSKTPLYTLHKSLSIFTHQYI